MRDGGFEFISPDLVTSDYHLLPNMEWHLAENKYSSHKDVISAVGDFLTTKINAFSQGNRSTATELEEMCGSEEYYLFYHIPWNYLGLSL